MTRCDWGRIAGLDGWTRIASLSASPRYLSEYLVQLCDDAYTVPLQHGPTLDPLPFDVAGLILWAPDEGAACRALSMEIERDSGLVGVVPEPLRICSRMNYAEIRKALRAMGQGDVLESASYRIATDGAFIHRELQNHRYAFFFRKRGGNAEPPYAAAIHLPRRVPASPDA